MRSLILGNGVFLSQLKFRFFTPIESQLDWEREREWKFWELINMEHSQNREREKKIGIKTKNIVNSKEF